MQSISRAMRRPVTLASTLMMFISTFGCSDSPSSGNRTTSISSGGTGGSGTAGAAGGSSGGATGKGGNGGSGGAGDQQGDQAQPIGDHPSRALGQAVSEEHPERCADQHRDDVDGRTDSRQHPTSFNV